MATADMIRARYWLPCTDHSNVHHMDIFITHSTNTAVSGYLAEVSLDEQVFEVIEANQTLSRTYLPSL